MSYNIKALQTQIDQWYELWLREKNNPLGDVTISELNDEGLYRCGALSNAHVHNRDGKTCDNTRYCQWENSTMSPAACHVQINDMYNDVVRTIDITQEPVPNLPVAHIVWNAAKTTTEQTIVQEILQEYRKGERIGYNDVLIVAYILLAQTKVTVTKNKKDVIRIRVINQLERIAFFPVPFKKKLRIAKDLLTLQNKRVNKNSKRYNEKASDALTLLTQFLIFGDTHAADIFGSARYGFAKPQVEMSHERGLVPSNNNNIDGVKNSVGPTTTIKYTKKLRKAKEPPAQICYDGYDCQQEKSTNNDLQDQYKNNALQDQFIDKKYMKDRFNWNSRMSVSIGSYFSKNNIVIVFNAIDQIPNILQQLIHIQETLKSQGIFDRGLYPYSVGMAFDNDNVVQIGILYAGYFTKPSKWDHTSLLGWVYSSVFGSTDCAHSIEFEHAIEDYSISGLLSADAFNAASVMMILANILDLNSIHTAIRTHSHGSLGMTSSEFANFKKLYMHIFNAVSAYNKFHKKMVYYINRNHNIDIPSRELSVANKNSAIIQDLETIKSFFDLY